jgi:lipopolysaccharide/colanic/teichoic acid biosynthesis glycosyltransferase
MFRQRPSNAGLKNYGMKTGLFLKALLRQGVTLWLVIRRLHRLTQIKKIKNEKTMRRLCRLKYFTKERKDEKHMRNIFFCKSRKNFIKRFFDLTATVPSVILLTPIFILIGFFVRIRIGSPVLFKQIRPGLHGKPFTIYKFRTMTGERDGGGNLLSDSERLTRLGQFLRMTSMDELPEFFNVIKGDMSIVGPRPLLMQYLDRYTPEQARRHEVKPGITGWAQVNGRNAISWEDKFKLDVWYVDNWSLWLDIKIILMTVVKVLRRDGISQKGEATAQEFLGSHAKAQRRKER